MLVVLVVLAGLRLAYAARRHEPRGADARGPPHGDRDAGEPSDAGGDGADGPAPADAQPPPRPPPTIRITGTAVLPDEVARSAVGPLPAGVFDCSTWCGPAAERIVEAYRARGYLYARAWYNDAQQPGVLWFDVDEGRMRVSFVGMSSIPATLFRIRLDLPGSVFQKEAFERSLAEQKKAFRLVSVSYRVVELEGYDTTVFGQPVPARTLEVHVVRHESYGWALDVGVSAAWGVIPSVKYSAANVLWPDDRLLMDLSAAVPYRRYVFDAAPRLTWVHGGFDASYRLPHFGYHTVEFLGLAPRADMGVTLSQYARADLQLGSFYLLRDVTVANLVSSWRDVEASLGVGVDIARVFSPESTTPPSGLLPSPSPSGLYSARAMLRASGKWVSGQPWSRRDRRTFANLLVDVCAPTEVRATLWGQYLFVWGRHRIFLRGRGFILAGSIPYWDDVELAGSYQRVFFGDLYWTHQAVQVELAYHIRLWRDWFEVGVFHDLSAFQDRISIPPAWRAMDGFGPSLHFLLLDQYALGIYEGIGFAPGKFSQTISFTVETAF